MADLMEMREEMSNLVMGAMKEAEEFQDSFERYSYLWVDDLQESMKNFLTYGRVITLEDLDLRPEELVTKSPPTLTQFQQQVRGSPAPQVPPRPRGGEPGFTVSVPLLSWSGEADRSGGSCPCKKSL